MSKQASPTAIGGFVVGAVTLVVAGLLIFGSGKFLTTSHPYVLYFEGAVNGLQVGAPVKFQGVPVGEVTAVKATYSTANATMRIPVIIEITEGNVAIIGKGRPSQAEGLKVMIADGMRAQLQTESFVTGVLFVQFEIYPDASPAEIRIDPDTALPELPTIPTTLQEVQHTIKNALEKIGQLPLEQIVTDIHGTLQSIERLVNSEAVQEIVRNLNTALTDVQQLVRNVNGQMAPMASSVTETMGDIGKLTRDVNNRVAPVLSGFVDTTTSARAALEQAQTTLSAANGVLAPESSLRYDLAKTLKELSAAARSLRVLADYLERNPNAVVFGKSDR